MSSTKSITLLIHDGHRAVAVENGGFVPGETALAALLRLSKQNPSNLIGWCHIDCRDQLDPISLASSMTAQKQLRFQRPCESVSDQRVGYIEFASPFLKTQKGVCYPTWMVSSLCGITHAEVLNRYAGSGFSRDDSFGYFLRSMGKRAMLSGVLCYSHSDFVNDSPLPSMREESLYETFRFVRQHYRLQWVFVLFLNLMVFEKRWPLLPLLVSLFYRGRKLIIEGLAKMPYQGFFQYERSESFDILIPTLARKKYLFDVLQDLANQTIIPQSVIIIEQNPDPQSVSELDYLHDRPWPFAVKHRFLHQLGACNARNIGLELVESELLFMADDDIRLPNDMLERIASDFQIYGNAAIMPPCLIGNEQSSRHFVSQAAIFGTAQAFVRSKSVKTARFDPGFEFGYGEDTDFGVQLRNLGFDVIHVPSPSIAHLKAPMGGFRFKPVLKWSADPVQPKPSPTIMLHYLRNATIFQVKGYKLFLLLNRLKKERTINLGAVVRNFKQRWKSSIRWARIITEAS